MENRERTSIFLILNKTVLNKNLDKNSVHSAYHLTSVQAASWLKQTKVKTSQARSLTTRMAFKDPQSPGTCLMYMSNLKRV